MKIKELLKITGGKLLSGNAERDVDPGSISMDSRSIKKGEFFIALKGPNFDGDRFAEDAFKKGAIGTVVTRCGRRLKVGKRIVIETEDTTKALQDIAFSHRMKFKIPVIAVTGSDGKTTVKEMIWKILSSRYNVLKNEGTKNNHIGVSQTLLRLRKAHEVSVLELGMNHKGEIRRLAAISKPSMAVITNIGPSHLEFLGDMEGIFDAKKEILESFNYRGLVILNGDDNHLSRIRDPKINIARFGLGSSCDFRATDIQVGKDDLGFLLNGKYRFKLKLLGVHNIYNALAAIAVTSQFGISDKVMRGALLDYEPTHMRLNLKKALNDVTIIDDSYNSNPLSMERALEVLSCYPARSRWVVFGDMLELGKSSRHFHGMIGEMIAKAGIDGLFTLGNLSKSTVSKARTCGMNKDKLQHCRTHDEIVDILRKITKKGDAILIKGSRGMRMELVIEKLIAMGR